MLQLSNETQLQSDVFETEVLNDTMENLEPLQVRGVLQFIIPTPTEAMGIVIQFFLLFNCAWCNDLRCPKGV